MLMKFQGQWMSVDISSSFFPKVVCTGEVKTCSRSSCHGTDRKAPACSAPPSCTAPVCHHSSLHSQEPPHTALLRCFVREMSQQPSRSRKSAGSWGHQAQQSLRLHHWPWWALLSTPFPSSAKGQAMPGLPVLGKGDAQGAKICWYRLMLKLKSQLTGCQGQQVLFWCRKKLCVEAVVISIYCKLLH